MKKFITVALMAAMALSLVSCNNGTSTGDSSTTSTGSTETSESTESTGTETASAAKVGTAVLPSQEADAESASFDVVYAAVIVDGDGKILDCKIDQTQYQPTPDNTAVDMRSKLEKGDDYGMVSSGASTMEWYSQVEAFEDYVVGMTGDEVAAIEMTDGKATDADLTAGCTISIDGFVSAVKAACDAASDEVGSTDKLAIAVTSSDGSSAEEAAYDTDFCAVTVDGEGKVTSCNIDAVQASVAIADGAFDSASISNNSKRALGDDYGMVAAGASTMEWYTQADNFENYVVGKTADEVAATALTDGKATDADLSAGCTIDITSILANTEKAISAADAE